MRALAVDGRHEEPSGHDPHERPTIPVPPCRESGIRLKVTRVPCVAATVDVVVCDLSRDTRSEEFSPRADSPGAEGPPILAPKRRRSLPLRRLLAAVTAPIRGQAARDPDQNEWPPSTSTVRALK